MDQTYYHYVALVIGPKPLFRSVAMPAGIVKHMAEAQLEKFGGPATAPMLEISRIFYGRSAVRTNAITSVDAIGPECAEYLRQHPDEQVLRVERYNWTCMQHYPDKKAEADARPVYMGPENHESEAIQ